MKVCSKPWIELVIVIRLLISGLLLKIVLLYSENSSSRHSEVLLPFKDLAINLPTLVIPATAALTVEITLFYPFNALRDFSLRIRYRIYGKPKFVLSYSNN